jgi:hypothetical protein
MEIKVANIFAFSFAHRANSELKSSGWKSKRRELANRPVKKLLEK